MHNSLLAAPPTILSTQVNVSFYDDEIPEFAANALETLYENMHSCIPYLRLYTTFRNVNTYVAREDEKIVAILLFEREHGKIEVLNQFISIDQIQIRRFAWAAFARYADANLISFSRIQTDIDSLSLPFRRVTLTDDFAVSLPETVEQYDALLGKSTRRHAKSCKNKLHKKYDDVRFEFYENDDANEQLIRHIAELHRARLKARNVRVDETMTERRITLSKRFDTMIGVVWINGRICAGSISYRVGRNYFASMLAHDPAYNNDSVGFLCAYNTVCESINRRGTSYHFGQSRFRYKDNLLATRREIDCVEIYRSRSHLYFNAGRVMKIACKSAIRETELWSENPTKPLKGFRRFVAYSLALARSIPSCVSEWRASFAVIGRHKKLQD